jgi:hypothetical protein
MCQSCFSPGARVLAANVVLVIAFGRAAQAKPYTYTINQSQSQINLTATGSILGGVLDIAEQFPDSPTRYMGTLAVEYPGGVFPGGSIYFPGGSSATADVMRGLFSIPRQVSPNVDGGAGTAPANYGVTMTAPIGIEIPPIPYPDPNNPISLGTLQSVQIDMALRNVVLDVDYSNTPIAIDGSSNFDATGNLVSGVNLGLTSGFADLNGSLVLHQDNLLAWGVALAALEGLALALPDLGLTVDGDLLHLNVNIGLGTRIDLSAIPDFLSLPNGATTPGHIAFNPVSQFSTLTLPIALELPDFGIPPEILDLNLRLDGQLVATATLPEPSTLMVFGLSAFGLLRRRCRGR